ncbi:arsenate reductase (glutaredoxin) [Litorimonas sp. WD9-15]|uniref:arsenate reductase (glutaredoxin) n=1 Tax=Litorimonas sp. WD9-15 TaxID=3418716 RepID=UPI003CFD9ABE
MLTIWHNPRCSKSRQTLALIEAAGKPVEIRKYLDDVPTAAEITGMLNQLGLDDPRALMRRGEAIYKELGLKAVNASDALLKAMSKHPKLIERPIVSDGERAIIGRPPEAVKTLL